MDDSKDNKDNENNIINLKEEKLKRLRKILADCGFDELDEYELVEILHHITKETEIMSKCTISLRNGEAFTIDKDTIKELNKESDDLLPDYLRIAQTHQTNALKGALSAMGKGRLKDDNYKAGKKSLGTETYYTLEYATVMGEKKKYKTSIAVKDLPNIRLAMDDVLFSKFFTFIHYQFNTHNKCLFKFNTRLFIEFLGKAPTRNVIAKTNKKLNEYCETILPSIRLKWSARGNQSETITPFAMTSVKRSIITISLEVSYATELKDSFYAAPKEIGQLSENAFLMADYIFTYARQCKKNRFSLKNDTLYKKTKLPTYEEVKNSSSYKGDTNNSIKTPFYRALKEIQDTLKHKLTLEEDELNTDNWESFKMARINFHVFNYTDTLNLLQKAQSRKIIQSLKQTTKNKKP
jgi:hypothetical protein